MNRPYVICHMVVSLDGKVTGDFLYTPEGTAAAEVYYQLNRDYGADGFACGRITMEGSFTGGYYPDLEKYSGASIPRTDHVADETARYFAVSFDRKGRLGWTESRIRDEDPGYDNAHIIEVLEEADDKYLAYLRDIGVSYIFASDIKCALEKLKNLFGISTLLLEGGSIINGAFASADVIDELSLVVAPISGDGKPLLGDSPISQYALKGVKQYGDGILFLNYTRRSEEIK
ncbi:MAG: dihydrofolate reductase family protein [Clostridia bacterium]|nr:dihydrofolate reductase family protein [Clostridia bacterium]